MIPLSLYVHIPWCVRKCPYCDFNSHESAGALPEADYVRVLLADLAEDIDEFGIDRPIDTIFFGGGTPSLFSPKAIGHFLERASRLVEFSPDIEITLEANPGTVSAGPAHFEGLRDAGINRLSMGIQSFNNDHLGALGRIHDRDAALAACDFARQTFPNFNLDLMHGLPGQDVEAAVSDLRLAIEQAPPHISWYQLTIEPNTVFGKRPPSLPDEDTLWDIYERGSELLSEIGYERYEVSAFSKPGMRCRHNLNYWQFGDYLGVGAGAHGKISTPNGNFRTSKTRVPRDYLRAPGRRCQRIGQDELPLEFLMNALRLCDGAPREYFEARTGLPASLLDGFIQKATARGLLEQDEKMIRPSSLGLQYLDSLLLLVDDSLIATS